MFRIILNKKKNNNKKRIKWGKGTYLVEVFKKCFEKTSLFPVYMYIISGGTAGAKRYCTYI